MKRKHSEEALKQMAKTIFTAAVAEVDPKRCIEKHFNLDGETLYLGNRPYRLNEIDNIYLIGIGKASAAMAHAVEEMLGKWIENGVVVTKYDHGMPLTRCRIFEAAHPIPDKNGGNGQPCHFKSDKKSRPKRSYFMPHLRRRVCIDASAFRRDLPGSQAGDHPSAFGVRGHDPRNQHHSKTSLRN